MDFFFLSRYLSNEMLSLVVHVGMKELKTDTHNPRQCVLTIL